MDFTHDADTVLMQRLACGEDLALNELMARWRERVAAFLFRMVGHHATAMDLTQETFVRLYTSRHSYKPVAAFSTYLFHIAANLARSQARWRKRHPTVPMEDEAGRSVHEAVDGQLAPDEAAALHEKTFQVNRAIAALPGELREALLLFTVEEMSQAEIAKTLGCTAKAVEVRIYRARQALREALAKEAR
ncbi:MAG: sigma-70 family RNA polymerase sigma factor [Verrucomicrobiales bacterium]|nr:sigma-70 family RNA polymerase sigma factor [Verrucomicrobiales bacterium]